jgi:hypothetical protein
MQEYRALLEKGAVQKAYKGLMEYIMDLRTFFAGKYGQDFVSGSIYFGYMDMTYFSLFPDSLKQRKLKIAVVFLHEACRFEVWLSGNNKQVQANYWDLIKASHWDQYHIVPAIKGYDSIIENVIVENPDFRDLDALTRQIETGALKFIQDIESFLTAHEA